MTALQAAALADYLQHPPPARVRDAPRRPAARRVRRVPRTGRRADGSPPSWRCEWARLPDDAHPHTWRQRLACPRGFARHLATIDPATEVPADRPAARAPSADRPLHLHRRGDHGVDGGRRHGSGRALRAAASRDTDRAAGRHRDAARRRRSHSTAQTSTSATACCDVRAGKKNKQRAGPDPPQHRQRAARVRPPARRAASRRRPRRRSSSPPRTTDGPRRAQRDVHQADPARSVWKAAAPVPGRGRMISDMPSRCARCSTGIRPARTSTGRCRCCPPTSVTSTPPATYWYLEAVPELLELISRPARAAAGGIVMTALAPSAAGVLHRRG